MRLLKSCGNGRTVDDGNQEEFRLGWLSIFIKMGTAREANMCLVALRRRPLLL